jgi:hypothetical protein
MSRLSRRVLLFALVCAVFFVAPALFSEQFSLYPLMKTGDVFDILTPMVFIPFYWLLYQLGQDRTPGLGGSVVFLVLAAVWVEGHGMHLAANSIGHLLKEMKGSDAYRLTHFYDEILSHYLLHLGIVGLSALLILRQWRNPFTGEKAPLWSESVAGIIHGFTYFVIVIEARTVVLGVPFAILVTLFGLAWGRGKFRQQPLLAFYFVAYVVATIFFVGWAIYWGGLPEFSAVGIID